MRPRAPRKRARKQTAKKKSPTPSRAQPTSRSRAWKVGGIVLAIGILTLLVSTVGAAQIENNDAFCASCHTQPEITYYQREHKNPSVDLASIHAAKGVKCIDCHSGVGIGGRLSAMMLGAHDALKYVSGHYPQPAPLTRPIPDTHCLKCHADVVKVRTFRNHFHVFLPRWQILDANAASCVDCHQSHTTNGDPKIKFLNKTITVARCQACHRVMGEEEEGG